MYRKIPLRNSNGLYALVDEQDYEHLSQFKWYLNSEGYAYRNQKSTKILMHHEIHGKRVGLVTDHVNLNKLDNRRYNLRFCTQAQNNRNTKPRGGDSQYTGVYRGNGKWRVDRKIDGKTHHLGTFKDEIDAAAAYNLSVLNAKDEYARINILGTPGGTISGRDFMRIRDRVYANIRSLPEDL